MDDAHRCAKHLRDHVGAQLIGPYLIAHRAGHGGQGGGKPATPAATPASASGAAPAGTAHDAKVQLFGTVEFKRPLSTLPGWLDLLKRNSMDPIFIPAKVFKKGVTWDNFKSKAPQGNKMELLRYVNSFWNTWPYVEDIVNWKQEDYWAIPAELKPILGSNPP